MAKTKQLWLASYRDDDYHEETLFSSKAAAINYVFWVSVNNAQYEDYWSIDPIELWTDKKYKEPIFGKTDYNYDDELDFNSHLIRFKKHWICNNGVNKSNCKKCNLKLQCLTKE